MLPFVLIALLSAVAQLFLPWWVIAPVAFLVCYWRSRTGWRAFGNGFAGVGTVWLIYALFIHLQTNGILTDRMSVLLLKSESGLALVLLTALIGGLVGGMAGLAGQAVRRAANAAGFRM